MKATGIVRRIDDLGRIVIPKEIRRTMRIREGDPLEIFTDNDGGVILRKYSPIGEMTSFAVQYAEALNRAAGMAVLICDRDHVVAAAGVSRTEYGERRVTPELEELMEYRTARLPGDGRPFRPVEGVDRMSELAVPIIAAGDVSGAVVMLSGDIGAGDSEVKLVQTAAGFLGRVMETG